MKNKMEAPQYPNAINADRWDIFRSVARCELLASFIIYEGSKLGLVSLSNELRWVVAGALASIGTLGVIAIHKPGAFKRRSPEHINQQA